MQFWSKGLGKKTIELFLSKGEALAGDDLFYLKGQMEAPVSWEYIMPLRDDDLVDFLALLREPALARYVHAAPGRWKLYIGMLAGGLHLAALIVGALLRQALGRGPVQAVTTLQIPPPSERKRVKRRRRLGSKTTRAPSRTARQEEGDPGPKAASAGGF